ncbi:MAG TPA: phosphatidate cytidylyltransferase, partial [Patescibacteria group bacterium]|nr:phosphatidate cytidylyltransferase [Patescibacteria group bacterium]
MLRKRIATAAVLIPLLIACIVLSVGRPGGWPFLLLCAVAAGLCANEGFRMFLNGARDRAGGVALAVLVFFSGALLPGSFGVPAVLVCVLLSVFHVLPGAADPAEKARRAATLCLGAVSVGGLLSTYPRTLLLPRGEHWVLLGILAVEAGDTMAYFTGRAVGRRKL